MSKSGYFLKVETFINEIYNRIINERKDYIRFFEDS